MRALQRTLSVIFPEQCLLCEELVDKGGALCPACWSETGFNTGHSCESCAAPLVGEGDGSADLCDVCLNTPRPWSSARAALLYSGASRRIVLGLKHGDRLDLVPQAAEWMARAGGDLLTPGAVLCPVPIHWSRRIRRKYNQSAELCRALGKRTGLAVEPDLLRRKWVTRPQDGMNASARFANQTGSMTLSPHGAVRVEGSEIVLVDDVMTSGATLTAATNVLVASGARQVSCLLLARAVKAH